jgi:hypothetical protein
VLIGLIRVEPRPSVSVVMTGALFCLLKILTGGETGYVQKNERRY